MRSYSTVLKLSLASLLLVAGACDDDGETPKSPDAAQAPDAGPPDAVPPDADPPDAMPDAGVKELRSGTVVITEVRVLNTELTAAVGEIRGAGVSVSFTDNMTGTAPTLGNFAPGSCTVTVYDVTTDPPDKPATVVDEGPISVTGSANGPFGCAFSDITKSYNCALADPNAQAGAAPGATLAGNAPTFQTVTVTLPNADFSASATVVNGTLLNLSGIAAPNESLNGIWYVAGPGAAANQLTVFNRPTGPVTAPVTGDANWAIVVGAAPKPTGFDFLPCADAAATPPDCNKITIAHGAGEWVPAFATGEIVPSANGYTLDSASASPTNMPFAAVTAPINFTCGNAGDPAATGGVCGPAGSGGLLAGTIVSGSTTDAPIPDGASVNTMPTPVSKWAAFVCSSVGGTTATITEAAWNAVLGTNPTRIQTTVLRGQALTGEGVVTNLVVGHSLIGWSTKPAAAE